MVSKKIKNEIRILGIDDAPFTEKQEECFVVAVVFRGGSFMDGLLSCKVKVDGDDSTTKLTELINKSKHKDQLKVIMLDGIALAGFNVVDINELSKKTRLPVIAVMRYFPDLEDIEKALQRVKNGEKKFELIRKAGKIYEVEIRGKKIFIQPAGISAEEASRIVKLSSTRSLQPEPLRVAHLIASGIVKGESRGRA